MRLEQYTCDRCQVKMCGHPKTHGGWTFSVGAYCVLRREPSDAGHLCNECLAQVGALMEVFWTALFPKLRSLDG